MKDIIFSYFKKRFLPLLASASLASLAGCIYESDAVGETFPSSPTGVDCLTISVIVPGQQIPTTRAYSGPLDAKVEKIDLLVFKSDGTLLEHVESPDITISEQSSVENEGYKVTFTAVLANPHADAETLAIVANVNDVASLVGSKTSKKAILEALIVNYEDGKAVPAIPMYGEINGISEGVTNGKNITGIELTRMLARIDVLNSASNFTLSKVHVVNCNSKGYIAKSWDSDGKLTNTLPNIPSDAGPKTGSVNALGYTYSASGISGEIYVCEVSATSGDDSNVSHTEALCLVMEGKYTNGEFVNQTYFYRVDFTAETDNDNEAPYDEYGLLNPDFDPTDVSYFPVKRNHLYSFEITEATGRGYDTFDEAINSLGVMNNLKTTLHVEDQSGIKNMVFNGQYYIGLRDEVSLAGESSGYSINVDCKSNYTGWKVEKVEYVNVSDNWLAASRSGNSIELTINDYGICEDRVAYVHLTAGRLTHKLMVTQKKIVLPVYIGKFGGKLAKHENDEWYFDKELWIQPCDESSSRWSSMLVNQGRTDEWNGKKNTFNLFSDSQPYEAAENCYNKNGGTPSEAEMVWYLPAKIQLMATWVSHNSFNTAKLASQDYWSSTESSNNNCWGVNFSNGTTSVNFAKLATKGVRCVRN